MTIIALTLGLVAAACANDSSQDAAVSPLAGARSDDDTETTEPLLLPTADGGEIDLTSLAGQDVMLWFWAPW